MGKKFYLTMLVLMVAGAFLPTNSFAETEEVLLPAQGYFVKEPASKGSVVAKIRSTERKREKVTLPKLNERIAPRLGFLGALFLIAVFLLNKIKPLFCKRQLNKENEATD